MLALLAGAVLISRCRPASIASDLSRLALTTSSLRCAVQGVHHRPATAVDSGIPPPATVLHAAGHSGPGEPLVPDVCHPGSWRHHSQGAGDPSLHCCCTGQHGTVLDKPIASAPCCISLVPCSSISFEVKGRAYMCIVECQAAVVGDRQVATLHGPFAASASWKWLEHSHCFCT